MLTIGQQERDIDGQQRQRQRSRQLQLRPTHDDPIRAGPERGGLRDGQ